jgi:sulfatase maturation enzyme AslB (radical SAM superfamily)
MDWPIGLLLGVTDKNIFCNAPWYELQIYWDGSLGFCCQEAHKLYPVNLSNYYNVSCMSIAEWFDSNPMRQARLGMLGSSLNSICQRCYHEQKFNGTSRRHKCNQKSVIFTKTNFANSYEQSPGYAKFESSRADQGAYDGLPIDLHIDLGNYCNLACKMCRPEASSVIAAQEVKWGNISAKQYVGTDWTRDDVVWNRVLNELANIDQLNNIHFMGGETLITKRFEDFVDYMIARGRTDLNFSFVTNGTTFNESLLNKLKQFKRVGIEVSIETITDHNTYQRQGTDTALVLENIQRYLSHCNGTNITLTARPAISALTIGNYHSLLQYCLEHKIMVKSLWVTRPTFLNPQILPKSIRSQYVNNYKNLIQEYNLKDDHSIDYNESDPNQLSRIILSQIDQCLNMLSQDQLPDSEQHLKDMVAWCQKWDNVYGYNARELYPELTEILNQYGY